MKYPLFLLAITSLFFSPVYAQTFDVASVRLHKVESAEKGRSDESITITAGTLIMRNVTLRSCMKWAYGIRDFQISGGPGWISTAHYDISARAAGPADDGELRKMLQSLLAQRFQLGVLKESKQLPVYAMVVARPKAGLKRSSDNGSATMLPGDGALEFRNTSMAELAERLERRPLAVDRPVIDQTGLHGGYDFALRFADNAAGLKGALEDVDRGTGQGESIFSVIQAQLGLKLEPQKAALPVFVVERAVENPGEN